jgi:SOS-response transcriptional repressor LexA
MAEDRYLNALRAYWKGHKAFPSMAKLTEVLGLTSTGGVFKALGRLVDAGYLERVGGRIAPTKKFFALPLLGGTARAGHSHPADQDEGCELMSVDDYLVDQPERTSFCRIKGDSMRDAGLLDGDMVVVKANSPTKPGDIVVAVVDNQITVKYLRTDRSKRWRLEPANPAHDAMRPSGPLEVLGVVVGSFRRIDQR